MIVADTNVLSEALRRRPDEAVLAWLRDHRFQIVLTSIVVGELRFGERRLAEGTRRDQLNEAIAGLVVRAGDRLATYDLSAAESYAELRAEQESVGRRLDDSDLMIAAIAHSRGYRLATRNEKHFRGLGLELINPWNSRVEEG